MLRDYQARGVQHAMQWAATASPTDRLPLASPTGTGKSFVALALLDALPGWYFVTPSLEIITGMLNKAGCSIPSDASNEYIATQGEAHRMYTPLRLKNQLMDGSITPPAGLVLDEAHHDNAATHQDIDALCACPKIGMTATPYRGTPRGTLEWRAKWGEPHWLTTLHDAAKAGHIALPTMQTWPLVDDDVIDVQGGELVVSQITGATRSKLHDLLDQTQSAGFWNTDGTPTRPTVYAMPSGEIAAEVMVAMQARGWKTCCITQATPRVLRTEILSRAAQGTHALINVRVVGEGVDLPLRRYIDCAPTLSPVLFMQRLGRIMRPSETPPEYIVCNNNLQRHFYLLDGAVPACYLTESIAAFGKLTRTAGYRAFGLEGLGRLKAIECKLLSGMTVHCYSISATNGASQTQYFVIVHPQHPRPVWAARESIISGGTMDWGRWSVCNPPSELTGFRSLPQRTLTEKQAAWWERDAKRFGLAEETCTVKLFPVLPVLKAIGVKLS